LLLNESKALTILYVVAIIILHPYRSNINKTEKIMALVKCAECKHWVSNRAIKCPQCGYEPWGECRVCKWFESQSWTDWGRCGAVEKDFIRNTKSVCPAVIKKSIAELLKLR
jgi:hypothetical protein